MLYHNKMKSKINLFLILFLIPLFVFGQENVLPSPTQDDFIYFTADEAIYDKEQGIAELNGNVEIVLDQNKTQGQISKIKAEKIQILTEQQVLITQGPTIIEQDGGTLEVQDIHFDIGSRRLIMKGLQADYGPIRVLEAKDIEVQQDQYLLKKAELTCCSLEKPHYTLYVGKADLIPQDRIIAYNAVLKVGKVPVFYFPFFYRSLNTDRLFTTYLDFDQSGNTGFGFLTSTVYARNNFRAAANLDYYTKSGIGYGLEVGYLSPQKFRGSMQAYTIYDREKDKQRWGIDGGYWWQMHDSSDSLNNKGGAIYFSQLETRNVSDADFNDDFFRANPYVVSPDKLTRASIVRQTRTSTFRVSYSNREQLNPDDKTYFNAEEVLPKVDWIFNPFVLPYTGGVVNNFSISFNNTKKEDYDFVQYFQAKWNSARDFKLHKNFTLTPSVFYNQEIILKDPTNNDEDKFVGRYGGQLNLRSNLITGMLDVGYRYTRRNQEGALTSENPFDNKEEENLVYIQNYYLPTPNIYFKMGSGYNLQNSQDSWEAKYRVEPILAEVGYFSQKTGSSIYVQNLYDVHTANQAFVIDAILKNLYGSSAKFGVVNYSTDRDSFLFNTQFTLAPRYITWRADMGIDFEVKDSTVHAYSKHIKVYKDFHDVSLMLGVRDRNKNLSFSFRINVMCGGQDKRQTPKQAENENYPWNDDRMLRD